MQTTTTGRISGDEVVGVVTVRYTEKLEHEKIPQTRHEHNITHTNIQNKGRSRAPTWTKR